MDNRNLPKSCTCASSRYAACLLVTHRRNSGAICRQPMPFVCVCATATCRQPAFQVFRRDSWFRPHQYFPPTALLAPTFLASCPISNLRRAGVFSVTQSVRPSVSLLSLSLSFFLSLSLASSLSHTRTHPLSKRLLHQRPSFMPEPVPASACLRRKDVRAGLRRRRCRSTFGDAYTLTVERALTGDQDGRLGRSAQRGYV